MDPDHTLEREKKEKEKERQIGTKKHFICYNRYLLYNFYWKS